MLALEQEYLRRHPQRVTGRAAGPGEQLAQAGPNIGEKRDAGKLFGDLGIGATEAFRVSRGGVEHVRRRHAAGAVR